MDLQPLPLFLGSMRLWSALGTPECSAACHWVPVPGKGELDTAPSLRSLDSSVQAVCEIKLSFGRWEGPRGRSPDGTRQDSTVPVPACDAEHQTSPIPPLGPPQSASPPGHRNSCCAFGYPQTSLLYVSLVKCSKRII